MNEIHNLRLLKLFKTKWIPTFLYLLFFQLNTPILLTSQTDIIDDFNIEHIDVSTGLSNNYVSKIIEDNQHIKWFATEGGVNKFDGLSFTHYKPGLECPGLTNENIETLFKDRKGNIWIGTKSGGLSKYNPIKDKFINYNLFLQHDINDVDLRITSIVEDDHGNIWIGSWSHGLYVLDDLSQKLVKQFQDYMIITAIIKDRFGNIWFSSKGQINKYDPSEDRIISFELQAGTIFDLIEDTISNQIIIASSKGIFTCNSSSYKIEELNASISGSLSAINCLAIDKEHRLWAGSWKQGLFVSDSAYRNFSNVKLQSPLAKTRKYDVVLDIHIDANSDFWIATGYGGVLRLTANKKFKCIQNTIKSKNGLQDDNVQSIILQSNNTLWLGTRFGGLFYSSNWSEFKKVENYPDIKINCLLEKNERIFIGTNNGLYSVNIKDSFGKVKFLALPKTQIKTLYIDKFENLWIGTQLDGLAVTNLNNDPEIAHLNYHKYELGVKGTIGSNRISTIIEDINGDLWIGTYNGLYLFDRVQGLFIRFDHYTGLSFPSVIFLSIFPDKDGKLWVGLPGGLFELQFVNDKLKILNSYSSKNGLFNEYVTAVTNDNYGNIWLTTAGGLAKLPKNKKKFINYGKGDGIKVTSFNINSLVSNKEHIIIGGADGFVFFNPDQIEDNLNPPEIILTNLKIDNKTVNVGEKINDRIILHKNISYTKNIELTYKEKIFSISYISSNYSGHQNLNYSYRLLGFRNDWINNASSTEVSYTSLTPGKYRFEVRASHDNVQFGKIMQLKITILPPPWATVWAYAIYVIILIGILFLIYIMITRQMKLKSSLEIAKIDQEKEYEIAEAKMRFFTNISHELRTPLTLIISPLSEILLMNDLSKKLKKRLQYIENNASRLLNLINQLLDFRRTEKGLLKLEPDKYDIVEFTKKIYLSFNEMANEKSIQYRFHVAFDELKILYDQDKMKIVLYNLLANAFKFTDKGGGINLKLDQNNANCIISISDSGIGISEEHQTEIFNRFYQVSNTNSTTVAGSGIGLSLAKKLIDLHFGEIRVISELNKGTEFIIELPLNNPQLEQNVVHKNIKPEKDLSQVRFNEDKIEEKPDIDEESDEDEKDTITSEKQEILIIDDNKDIRNYLKDLLNIKYHTIEAENGLVGLNLAKEHIPDLIISDIMMPEMDGITLSSKLKKDIATSHIPIILLTARTSNEFEVDGLQTGADDYIRKPFNATIVKTRIEGLLKNRQKVRDYYLNKIRFEANAEVVINDTESDFIEKAIKLVEGNMNNEDFGIDFLTDKLFMSQSTLFRKIKSLTGMSITGFIRSLRLKAAANLIRTEDMSLSQISYEVGFNDYKYFKKSFKEQFECLPSEYRKSVQQHKS